MQFQDYYRTLGVDKTASADEIKKAYRKLARKYHPDVSKEKDAAARMAEVNEANEVLSDPEKRSAYDTVGAQAWAQGARSADDVRPPPGWNEGFQFRRGAGGRQGSASASGDAPDFEGMFGSASGGQHSEFFEELFGRAARQQARQGAAGAGGAPPRMRGQDEHAAIELDLLDSYNGAERQLSLRVPEVSEDGRLHMQDRVLHVKIPRGVVEGQMIRLAGQGGPGIGGGAAGDLLLEVRFKPDPRWRIEGADVTQRVFVSPWEAAIGGAITVTTPEGAQVQVNVPAGSGSGNKKLRLKGRGIPRSGAGKEPGDLYLELVPAIPGAATDAQKKAWADLATAYPGFNPRSV